MGDILALSCRYKSLKNAKIRPSPCANTSRTTSSVRCYSTAPDPEKNTAIMQISFKLGLRVQEIALLELKEVCRLSRARKTPPRDFELLEVMTLPAAYTKGADALGRSRSEYQRKTVSFSVDAFDQIVEQIEALAKAGAAIDPTTFYPPLKKHKGKSRDLPLVDEALRSALTDYLTVRLETDPSAKRTGPLFLTQKGGPYSPNTLQEHIALMLRDWVLKKRAHTVAVVP